MIPDNSDDYVTRRDFEIFRRMSWFRVVFGVAAAVLVTLVVVSSTVRENSIEACKQSTLERVATAHKDMADFKRERLLSLKEGDTDAGEQHALSANAAHTAAIKILIVSGSTDPVNAKFPTKEQRHQFCQSLFPETFPNNVF